MNSIPIRDIHLPELPGWWPIAPGWWLLLILIIVLVTLLPWLLKKLRQKSLNQLASQEFMTIQSRYEQNHDKARLVQELSVLLRRTGMSLGSRQQAAGLTGTNWTGYLASLTSETHLATRFERLLSTDLYRKEPDFDAEDLLRCCQQWLQALPEYHNRAGR